MGDVIYKKKYMGNHLFPDKNREYKIIDIRTVVVPAHVRSEATTRCTIALLDDFRETDIIVGEVAYIEKKRSYFCCWG